MSNHSEGGYGRGLHPIGKPAEEETSPEEAAQMTSGVTCTPEVKAFMSKCKLGMVFMDPGWVQYKLTKRRVIACSVIKDSDDVMRDRDEWATGEIAKYLAAGGG